MKNNLLPIKTAVLTPAYGRDYTNKQAVCNDFENGKDFIFNKISSFADGKICNKKDLIRCGYTHITLRYNKLTKGTFVKVVGNEKS
jgi:hypothetical protein